MDGICWKAHEKWFVVLFDDFNNRVRSETRFHVEAHSFKTDEGRGHSIIAGPNHLERIEEAN
jgi:hypothetical protein